MNVKIFTEDSQKLIEKFKKKVFKTDELQKLYEFLDNYPVNNLIEYSKEEYEIFNETKIQSEFVSEKIIKHGKKFNKKIVINLKNNKINVTVSIYHKLKNDQTKLIKIISQYIQYIVSLSNTNRNININIYLTGFKKYSKNGIPDKDSINSGSCLNNGSNSEINIWRKEELLKVMVHELIHALCFDRYSDNENIINHYKSIYNLSSNVINTGEAYTEIWANILNCYLISKIYNKGEEYFYRLMGIEKDFCLFQAHKIFYLTGINKKKIDVNKYSNVLSYYIIRMELYNNIDGFLKFCRLKNINYIQIIHPLDYLIFLKNNSEINKIKSRNQRFNNIQNNNFIFKTMRFSAIELKV